MGGKKKGKKKGKKEPKAVAAPFPHADAILAQFDVNAASKKINELTTQNKELNVRANNLKAELEQTKAEQADVYIYLHKKLDDNFDVIAGLEDRIQELTTDAERRETVSARELEGTKTSADKTIAMLQGRVDGLQDQLDGLQEFREQKESIEGRLAQLMADLDQERKQREEEVAELERRNVAAKDKLKKEMFLKIKETKQNILESTNDQLDAATKRTMAENEQMTTELQYQSKETERLLGKYARLQDENAQLRRDRELVEETQRELVKRTHFYQRLIKKLHERIQEEGLRRPKSPIVTLDDEAEESRALISDLHRQVDELHGELKEAHVEADIARSEARHATTEYKRVVALQDETVAFLMQSVADVKQQIASAAHSGSMLRGDSGGGGGAMPPRLDRLPPQLRERALQQLLAKMQLFQTTLWAGEGAMPMAMAVASGGGAGGGVGGAANSGVSLPPIVRPGSSGGGSGPATPSGTGAGGGAGAGASRGRSPKAVTVSVAVQTMETAASHPSPSNPFMPAADGRSRKFRASGLRGSSATPTYPTPLPDRHNGSDVLPQRPNVRVKRVYRGPVQQPPPRATGTGFSNELSGRPHGGSSSALNSSSVMAGMAVQGATTSPAPRPSVSQPIH